MTVEQAARNNDPFLTIDQVAEMLGISKTTIWRLNKQGEFPAPVRFGGSVRWRKSGIEDHLDEKQARADADAASRRAEAGYAA